mmetsp:Transcript_11087/g.15441  ORF Transcript_11087/g.15441 Transcript_11087/m.15441 type:complete len:547 (+) Transcript_11087:356-1996(+)|eukprot:CAMPEP_0184487866 /NCGR_PEP_ID=MMETSP0113_2-20130426/10378_1 /TAXON_ID=91329 /ORGANISM="Norrisiella sphaerica, Strain BC52" /LENGTH=546 /DNA_ID=CAMNT_0026870283 /DNA_START=361 /DNA_END=2001 /DNA_ORIENTATION=-
MSSPKLRKGSDKQSSTSPSASDAKRVSNVELDQLKHGKPFETPGDLEERIVQGKRELASWNFVRGIGVGQFGSVVVVQPKNKVSNLDRKVGADEGRRYAMKCIGKYSVIAENAVQRTLQELLILTKVDNPFIIKLCSAFQDETNLYLITELCEGGTLEGLLVKHNKLETGTVQILMGQLLLALEQVHLVGIVHMDVKPENCLLDAKGNLRLADFNASQIKGTKKGGSSRTSPAVGTPGYMAPEILSGKGAYGSSPDFWGMGVCVFRLLHGHQTWPYTYKNHQGVLLSRVEMLESIQKTPIPDVEQSLPKEIATLINGLLAINPLKRLGCGPQGVDAVKNQGFFASLSWKGLAKREISSQLTLPPNALFNDAADKITLTKWAVEQFKLTHEAKAPLSELQQFQFRDWHYIDNIKPNSETLLDRFITMKPQKVRSFLNASSDATVEELLKEILKLKRKWLDENCKLSLAEFANQNLKIENAQLEEQINGLTKELHHANVTVLNLKKSFLESSSTAKQGANILNPLTPILRKVSSNLSNNEGVASYNKP